MRDRQPAAVSNQAEITSRCQQIDHLGSSWTVCWCAQFLLKDPKMISVRGKSSQIGQYLKATSSVVPSQSRPVNKVVHELKIFKLPTEAPAITAGALGRSLPQRSSMLAVSGSLTAPCQIRLAHTDLRVPSFEHYRKVARKEPNKSSRDTDVKTKQGAYLVAATFGVASMYSAKNMVALFIESMGAAADVLAMSKIEVDISTIPEGEFLK